MSTKAFAFGCVLLVSLSAFATESRDRCGYPGDILKFEEDLGNRDTPALREQLTRVLRCLRAADLEAGDKDREGRIELLESLAMSDLKRLTDRVALLDKLQANGPDAVLQPRQVAALRSIEYLTTVARLVDGKPVLVSNLFTEARAKNKKKTDADAAQKAEDAAKDACKEDDAALKLTDLAGVKRCVDVLSEALAANAIAAEKEKTGSKNAHWLDKEEEHLKAKLARVQDAALPLTEAARKSANELAAKAEAASDAEQKKKLVEEQKKTLEEIELITDVAVEPSARRHCIDDEAVSVHLKDAKDVERCVNVLTEEIDKATIAAEAPDLQAARDHVADLTQQLARIKDSVALLHEVSANAQEMGRSGRERHDSGPQELSAEVSKVRDDQQRRRVPVVTAARSICAEGGEYLLLGRGDDVEKCVEGVRHALAGAEGEKYGIEQECAAAKLRGETLKRQLRRAQKAGAAVSIVKAKESERLKNAIAAATDADEKKKLTKQRSDVDDEIVLLTDIAVNPTAAIACEDPDAHLDIDSAVYITRCIHALTTKVRHARADSSGTRRQHRIAVAKPELQLALFEEAGRRMARLKGDELVDLAKKHDAATSPDDKTKFDDDRKRVQADIDSLRKVIVIPNEDPQTEYADFEQWFALMSAGYEYVGASNAFAKGFPRIGGTFGFHYAHSAVPEASNNWHPIAYGLYNTFTIALTNSGEAKPTKLPDAVLASTASSKRTIRALDETPTTTTATPDTTNDLVRALDFDFEIFNPWWRNDYQLENPRLRSRVGPILVIGGRKLDNEAFLHAREYLGIRVARSPETYYDVMYGRTGGLVSRRLEARGQYALPHTFKNGARLAIGAVGNFGANKRKRSNCDEESPHCRVDEKDVVKFYISYDIGGPGFLNFFGIDKKTSE